MSESIGHLRFPALLRVYLTALKLVRIGTFELHTVGMVNVMAPTNMSASQWIKERRVVKECGGGLEMEIGRKKRVGRGGGNSGRKRVGGVEGPRNTETVAKGRRFHKKKSDTYF